jgi:phosphoribosylanthranilate isomerase
MIVKVCGITRREDAEAAVEAGASALGFIFYKSSPRCVTPDKAAALGDGLSVCKVGVFVEETAAAVEAAMRAANLDVAQIYGGQAPPGARVWKAFRIADSFDRALGRGAEAVFLDGAGSGMPFNWAIARGAAGRVIVAGGLDASNVREAIRIAHPWGVDASSRLESEPGVKDHEKLRRFIKTALAEENP